jgi:hypothetical protein
MAENNPKKRNWFSRMSRGAKITLIAIILLLVAIRIALPYVLLHYLNKTLAHMENYRGHIRDIDLSIYRGAYKVKDIYLHRLDKKTKKPTKFFDAALIDLSVEWRALFHGAIKGKLEFDDPALYFTKEKVEPGQLVKDSSDFRVLLKKFMPLSVNRFEVNNGKVHYIDSNSTPKIDLEMNKMHILATNLRNVYKPGVLLPSTIEAKADVYEGTFDFNMKLNPLADSPTFDMNAELKHTNLVKLNEFFKAYGHFDVNRGRFGLYTEMAARNGEFDGYVKPIIKDLDVRGPEDKKDPLVQKIWESIVGTGGVILRNQRKDQVATKLPMQGRFAHPGMNIWYSILELLRNAFIQALRPSLDQEINIQSVDGGAIKTSNQPNKNGNEQAQPGQPGKKLTKKEERQQRRAQRREERKKRREEKRKK